MLLLIYDASRSAGENIAILLHSAKTGWITLHSSSPASISTPLLSRPTQQFNNEYEMPPN